MYPARDSGSLNGAFKRSAMVEVKKSSAVSPPGALGRRQSQSQQDGGGLGGQGRGPTDPVRRVTDVAQIMGIPARELTPRVQEALTIIVGEYDRLKEELERKLERIRYLEELADQHPFLSVLNRRAFLREMSQRVTHAERTSTTSTLVVYQVHGIEAARRKAGRIAADHLLAEITDVLNHGVRASDLVGNLGGSDFGVVLALTEGMAAWEKAGELATRIDEQLRTNQDDQLAFAVEWGQQAFGGGSDVSDVLNAADQDLRQRRAERDNRSPQLEG